MKKTLTILAAVLISAGCPTMPSVQVETQIGELRPVTMGDIRVFESQENLDALNIPYKEIAVLRIDSAKVQSDMYQAAFVEKAKSLGADAVVIKEKDSKLMIQGTQQTTSYIYRALAIDLSE